jgi:hypothetical protein
MTLLKKIISSQNLENAFNIFCKQRKDYSAQADIWDLRYNTTLRERSSKF